MRHILTFPLFEAQNNTFNPADWDSLPEWQLLRLMGFKVDKVRPNGTVVLSQPYSSVMPRLTPFGYVRTSDQGYVFRDTGPNPLQSMLLYLLNRFAKKGIPTIPLPDLDEFVKAHPEMLEFLNDHPKIKQGVLARTGVVDPLASVYDLYQKHGISLSVAKWLDKSTLGKWTLDEATGLVDIEGDFTCPRGNKLGFRGVKFGVVSGNFIVVDIGLTTLTGSPLTVGENFDCQINNLSSLQGAPQNIGGRFSCDAFQTANWTETGWLDILYGRGYVMDPGKAKVLVSPLIQPKDLDAYFKKNPLDLDVLDEFPDIKKGVLQRTGLPDIGRAASLLRSGLF